jgi:hypothetical protein
VAAVGEDGGGGCSSGPVAPIWGGRSKCGDGRSLFDLCTGGAYAHSLVRCVL